MKIIIAGGRDFDDYELLVSEVEKILKGISVERIVSGHADGADALGEKYAFKNDLNTKIFPAQWNLHGKAAGMIRNNDMAIYSDMLIAFWDGKSAGTRDMINKARLHDLKVHVILYGRQVKELF